jgi:hypothetical protein
MLFPLKICTQSIAQQAFAKPAWAGKEIGLALIYKIIDVICFIDIQTTILSQFLKTLYTQRIIQHNTLLFSGSSMRKDNDFSVIYKVSGIRKFPPTSLSI